MFEHPPAFLEAMRTALASLGGWFDWNALEAIGTVGALWFAVVQSSRSARAERVRQIGTLTQLVGLVEPITEAVPIIDEDPGGVDADLIEYLMDQHDIVQRAIDGLERIPLADVAAVGATEFVGALPLVLGFIREGLPTRRTDKVAAGNLNGWASYVSEACDFFREERDYIRYGRLGSRWRARLRSWESAYWSWRYSHVRQPERAMPPATVSQPSAGPKNPHATKPRAKPKAPRPGGPKPRGKVGN